MNMISYETDFLSSEKEFTCNELECAPWDLRSNGKLKELKFVYFFKCIYSFSLDLNKDSLIHLTR